MRGSERPDSRAVENTAECKQRLNKMIRDLASLRQSNALKKLAQDVSAIIGGTSTGADKRMIAGLEKADTGLQNWLNSASKAERHCADAMLNYKKMHPK